MREQPVSARLPTCGHAKLRMAAQPLLLNIGIGRIEADRGVQVGKCVGEAAERAAGNGAVVPERRVVSQFQSAVEVGDGRGGVAAVVTQRSPSCPCGLQLGVVGNRLVVLGTSVRHPPTAASGRDCSREDCQATPSYAQTHGSTCYASRPESATGSPPGGG
jgi:hypothetical protein